jgi:hypothetical protein
MEIGEKKGVSLKIFETLPNFPRICVRSAPSFPRYCACGKALDLGSDRGDMRQLLGLVTRWRAVAGGECGVTSEIRRFLKPTMGTGRRWVGNDSRERRERKTAEVEGMEYTLSYLRFVYDRMYKCRVKTKSRFTESRRNPRPRCSHRTWATKRPN